MSQIAERKKRSRCMKKGHDSIPAFLLKTYDILENPIYQDIISWNEDGTAFVVKKVNEFSEQILPKSFKHNNFASFVRQLNMYDFHKTRHDNNENEFKHKLFKRGMKHLLHDIKRKTNEQRDQNSLSLIKSEALLTGSNDVTDLSTQVAILSTKQSELEKLIRVIIRQNEKYQKENKYLWNELMKNRQQNESQHERLLYWILQNVNKPKTKIKNSQNMLMLKNEGENQDQQMMDGKQPQLKANLEAHLESLTKNQLLQGIISAFSKAQSEKTKRKLTDDEISIASDDEQYPPTKKVMYDPTQLMLGYDEQRSKQEEDQYIMPDYQEYLSRKGSFYDQDINLGQFYEDQL